MPTNPTTLDLIAEHHRGALRGQRTARALAAAWAHQRLDSETDTESHPWPPTLVANVIHPELRVWADEIVGRILNGSATKSDVELKAAIRQALNGAGLRSYKDVAS